VSWSRHVNLGISQSARIDGNPGSYRALFANITLSGL